MKVLIYWSWFKIFRKSWYTGNRIKYQPDLKEKYHCLFDLGPLTIAVHKENPNG